MSCHHILVTISKLSKANKKKEKKKKTKLKDFFFK